jgi:CheY-like chemotaxis protein
MRLRRTARADARCAGLLAATGGAALACAPAATGASLAFALLCLVVAAAAVRVARSRTRRAADAERALAAGREARRVAEDRLRADARAAADDADDAHLAADHAQLAADDMHHADDAHLATDHAQLAADDMHHAHDADDAHHAHLAAPEAQLAADDPHHAQLAAARGRILVIDDEADVARILVRALEPEHEVHAETDPDRALARLRAGEEFDVVFCDVVMPALDGLSVHDAIQKVRPAQAERFVFLTGAGRSGSASIASVGRLVVEKPFDLDAVRTLAGNRGGGVGKEEGAGSGRAGGSASGAVPGPLR